MPQPKLPTKFSSALLKAALLLLAIPLFASAAQAQERIKDVIYLKAAGCAYTMDVFKPKTPNHAGIIFIVSGGWFSNHEMINTQLAGILNSQGYTVFEVVHGSQPKYTIPEIVPQLRKAIRFIHANAEAYGVDPNRLGLTGASAGGHLSLLLAGTADQGNPNATDPVDRQPDTVKTVVAFFPPTDFLNWGGPGKSSFKIKEMEGYMPAFGVTPATPESKVVELDQTLAPIHFVSATFPPTLLVHGDADPLVPIQQSKVFDAALATKGVDHKFFTVKSGKHDANTMIGGLAVTLAWFAAHLKS